MGIVSDPSAYPLAKAITDLGYLRSIPELECHTPIKSIIYKIRHSIRLFTDQFFTTTGFTLVDMPTITFSECEGGCQPFQTTLLLTSGKKSDIPTTDSEHGKTDDVDFSTDFFKVKASLTVSSQLELETQLPLGSVYTMTRAFRGEPSQTSKHLCEFSMLEIELISSGAEDIIDITEKYIRESIGHVIEKHMIEFEFLEKQFEKPIISSLHKYRDTPFIRTTHADVVTMIKTEASKGTEKFVHVPEYDEDLSSEHEKFIVEHYGLPVVVRKYPKKIKAFYMPVVKETESESHGVEHVDSFDILVPEVGELVGGSQRIHEFDLLMERIIELGLDLKPLEFYIKLRQMGTVPHGGMGMGLERLIKFITGAPSVKDCVAFPRFIGSGIL